MFLHIEIPWCDVILAWQWIILSSKGILFNELVGGLHIFYAIFGDFFFVWWKTKILSFDACIFKEIFFLTNSFFHFQSRSESMASVYSADGGRYGTVNVKGEVEFGLIYNLHTGSLELMIKQCKDLAAVDTKRNRSDP